jgi:hypothetical protein
MASHQHVQEALQKLGGSETDEQQTHGRSLHFERRGLAQPSFFAFLRFLVKIFD